MKKIHQMKKDKEDALLKKREEAERKVSFLISLQAYKDHQNFRWDGILPERRCSGSLKDHSKLCVFGIKFGRKLNTRNTHCCSPPSLNNSIYFSVQCKILTCRYCSWVSELGKTLSVGTAYSVSFPLSIFPLL